MEGDSKRRMGTWGHPYIRDNSLELVLGNKTSTW